MFSLQLYIYNLYTRGLTCGENRGEDKKMYSQVTDIKSENSDKKSRNSDIKSGNSDIKSGNSDIKFEN